MYGSYGKTCKDDTISLYLLARLLFFTRNGSKLSMPTLVNGGLSGRTLHLGRSAMSCWPAAPRSFLQLMHLDKNFLIELSLTQLSQHMISTVMSCNIVNVLLGHWFGAQSRKLGPESQLSLFKNTSTVCPLETWSAGFRLVLTYLHCEVWECSRIVVILLATEVLNLVPSLFKYFSTAVLSVQRLIC